MEEGQQLLHRLLSASGGDGGGGDGGGDGHRVLMFKLRKVNSCSTDLCLHLVVVVVVVVVVAIVMVTWY